MRKAAAEALDKLGWQPDRSELGAACWAVKRQWDKCVEIGIPAVEPLSAALKDYDEYVRRAAAKALGQIGDMRAVEPLSATLKDYDKYVRRAAAEALGQIGDMRAVEPLSATLQDQDRDVRRAAAEALGQIGDMRAVEPLSAALQDQDQDVREAAAWALDKLGWQPDRSELGAAYWAVKRHWDKCVEIGIPAVEPLIAVLGSYSGYMRKAAAEALVKLYHHGALDDHAKRKILAQKERMAEPHEDFIGCTADFDKNTGIGVNL